MNDAAISVIMAAGRGSRMNGYKGNKTLLPLTPEQSQYQGQHPILKNIINNLPNGCKTVVVNYKKEDIIEATKNMDVSYCEQPLLNGTGGALIAAKSFLETHNGGHIIITMGDVPFIKKQTYSKLLEKLNYYNMVVLGFCPSDKKQYGVLETNENQVCRIIEWKYWKDFSIQNQEKLTICNSGIYAVRKKTLLKYISLLSQRPQKVKKMINNKAVEIEEFFITDIVEYMVNDNLSVGYIIADSAMETIGVDDLSTLSIAQQYYKAHNNNL